MIKTFFIVVIMLSLTCSLMSASNAVVNSGFENDIADWGLSVYSGCRLTMNVDVKKPHSGKKAILFTCKSPATPHVFGRLSQNISVIPDTEYILSAWVRAIENNGMNGETHFTDWNTYQLPIPGGTYDWKKISLTFRTQPAQTILRLGCNIADLCTELAIDDIALYPASQSLVADGIDGYYFASNKIIGHDTPGELTVSIESQKNAVMNATIGNQQDIILDKTVNLKKGTNFFAFKWSSKKIPFGKLNCSIKISDSDGNILVSGNQIIEKADTPLFDDLEKSLSRKKEFDDLYKVCIDRNIRADYPTAAKTMLDQFIPFVEEDIRKGHDWRAAGAIKDFSFIIEDSIELMKKCIDDPDIAPVVNQYKTSTAEIDRLSIIADRVDSFGRKSRGPIFFNGYGHFEAIRKDMPLWPGYGINIVQESEIGPSMIYPKENKIDRKTLNQVLKAFDDAEKQNVKIDFLLSPHYFPDWAMEKWPDLAKGGGGFLGFNVDAPEAKQVVERYLRFIVPLIKDKPALLSFCLTNEPVFNNTVNTPNLRPMWNEYLKKVYGNIQNLNENYGGTAYQSFNDVPVGGSWDDPFTYDYCIFNNERFSGWHKWMSDIIHEMAPEIPVHAKIMSTQLDRNFAVAGTDHELFGQLLEMNGNDCYAMGAPPKGFSVSWQLQNSSYDMQRSFVEKPIFNSENHLTPDTSNYYIDPKVFRFALWQGAIHGQSATTIWVWERSFDPGNPLYGHAKDRPACAYEVGITCMDLNRYADEVTALQHVKALVAIHYSLASVLRNQAHIDSIWNVYTALNFCGVKVDFISDRQLIAGKGSQYKVIVLPESTHVPQKVFDSIKDLPESVRLIMVNDCLIKDSYNIVFDPINVNKIKNRALCISRDDVQNDMWPIFLKELASAGGLPIISVVDKSSGKPIWGVEWLTARVKGKDIINMINLTDKPVDVKIKWLDIDKDATDLLSLGIREKVKTLKPALPVLAEIDY